RSAPVGAPRRDQRRRARRRPGFLRPSGSGGAARASHRSNPARMNKGRRRFLLTCWGCGLAALPLQAQTRRKGRKSSAARRKPAPTPPLPEGVLAELVPARLTDGGLPREATALSGSWSVDPVAKVLQVAPTPLLDAWLEFGPEIREKGAQITASGQAPHRGRILSGWESDSTVKTVSSCAPL